jgi:hypothetical protein
MRVLFGCGDTSFKWVEEQTFMPENFRISQVIKIMFGLRGLVQAHTSHKRIAGLVVVVQVFVVLFLAVPVRGQQWWSAPADLGGVTLASGPGAVSGGQHKIDVFYRGPNNHLWTSWWPDKPGGQWWSAPADLGGVMLTSEPVAVKSGSHQIDVFYRGPNNHLWTSWWPDKPGNQWWSAPTDLGGEALTSAPAAVVGGHNRIDVFYRGPNNHLWTSWWPDKPGSQWWSAPTDLGGEALTSAPAAVVGGHNRIDVFYRGPNNHLWTSWWPDKPGSQWWSGATDLGGESLNSAPSAVANARHSIDVFYSGPNSHLWTSWWPDKPGGQWWSAPTDLGGVALSSVPGAIAAGKDQIDVFYRGPDNHLWTSWWPDKPWLDVQSGQPSPHAAPYDLVTQTFDPDNGLPLNPMLGSQTWASHQLADPSLCGGGDPWKPPCTIQNVRIDNNVSKCELSEGPLKGHANWGLATYEGRVYWENHSYYLQDDDYSFLLYRDDLAGMTKFDVDKGFYQGYLHSEFNSDQTINDFHTWYWDTLHQAVDADAGKGGVMGSWDGFHIAVPPYTKTRQIFDGNEAIVMGLYGLDCAHDCGAELHPVYALAIHVKDDPADDTWAIFVRNWGDEGYCSSGQERIQPVDQPFTFSFRFKRPGATQVSSIPAAVSDPAGEFGTSFFGGSDQGGAGLAVFAPILVPNQGAVMTFALPPSSQGGRINGMLHLKWTVAAQANIPAPYREQPWTTPARFAGFVPPSGAERAEGPEGQFTPTLVKMTPEQRTALEKSLATPRPRPTPVKLAPKPAPARQRVKPVKPPDVRVVADSARQQREDQLQEALKKTAPPK